MTGTQRYKFSACIDCLDRVADPNCHSTCEKYLKELADYQKFTELKKAAQNVYKKVDVSKTRLNKILDARKKGGYR